MSPTPAPRTRLFAKTGKLIAALCPPVLLATLALINQGVPLSQLELNDGSVWLTSNAELKLGRYNPRIDELDGGLVSDSGRFDVRQEGNDVILVEPTTATVVETATVAAAIEVPIPSNAEVQLQNRSVAMVDSETGDMWLQEIDQLGSVQTDEDAPIALGSRAGGVLAETGRLLTVTEDGTTSRYRLTSDGDLSARDTGRIGNDDSAGEWDDLTAVGEQIIGLRDGQVHVADASIDIGPGEAVLQQPGPEADDVLVALEDRLLAVPLSGDQPQELSRVTPGTPAAPVVVDGCRHAAWASDTDNYVYDCDESSLISPISLEDVSAADELVFRVNRSVVVLNDVRSGRLWIPQEDIEAREPNWQDIVPEEEPEETDDSSGDPSNEALRAECTENSPAPQANDDDFGVRAGRSRTLPVLDNDTTSDCGILAISEFDEIPSEFGEIQSVAGGRALQLNARPNASGSVEFTYTVTDGRGSSTPSTATVQLTIRPPGENGAPVQERVGTLEVEQGAEATYNILADFSDPDGDELFITNAYSTTSGSVRFRNDGQLTFVADGEDLGRRDVRVVVSDGTATTEGSLQVDVRPAGSLPPLIDPLHEIAYVDEEVTIEPLEAVRSATEEPATLASVEEPAGTEVDADSEAGTFTFSASQTGTYYVPFSIVAMPHEAVGLARIDVQERADEPQPPQAVRDIAMLPPGGEVTIDPLANDIDPTRGVLVLQSVDVPDDSGLQVAVRRHQLLQISATRVLEEPVTFTYVVSNSAGEAEGEVTVLPVPASESQRAPVVPDAKVSVQTGGVVTIPVLEDAYDPDGDPLTLERELPEPLPAGEGLMFVSGDVLRYQAPSEPLTTHAVFAVSDPDGNTTSAQVTIDVHESDAETKAPPTPKDLTERVFAGETVRVRIPLVGIDPDGDGVVLLGQADAPTKGRIVDTGADWLEYEALPGERGVDTFTYAVEDWVGQRAVAEVRVGIAERPTSSAQVIARDDEVTVRPGELVEVRVLGNDIDASGGDLILSPDLQHEPDVDARVAGRRILVQTEASQDGSVLQIGYEITNERGGRDTAVLTVHVDSDAELLPPIARDVVVPASDTIDRSSIEVDVLEVAENPSGSRQDLKVSVPSAAADVATVTADRSIVVELGESSQTIPYLLTNTQAGEEDLASYAFITVPALGDYPPMLRPRAPRLTVIAGEELVIPIAEQVKVAPGKRAQITSSSEVTATRSDGSDLVEDRETLRFQAPRNYAGPASISFEVTDGDRDDPDAGVRSFTLPITVYGAEDNPPKFSPSTVEVSPGEAPRSIDLDAFTSASTSDPETDSGYSYKISGDAPAGFEARISGSQLLVGADIEMPRGSTGAVDINIEYGGANTVQGSVPLRVVASSRPLARVLDHEVSDGVEGEASRVSVLDGAFNPFDDASLSVVSATVETPNAGTASVQGSNVNVRPDAGFIGTMVTRYRVADGTGDSDREVEGRIKVRVRGAPDAPSRPRVREVRDRTVVLSWDAPTSNGESIDRYRVNHSPGGDVTECSSTTCTIDGLTNDTTYRFTVQAHNAVGWSEASGQSDEARPDAKPSRPSAPELEFGDGKIEAKWSAPDSPGSPVKNYQLQISPAPSSGATVNTSRTSHTFEGLRNGTQYTVRVRAENDAPDPSDWSDGARSTPAGAPERPSVDASKRGGDSHGGRPDIKATWKRPASNGAEITAYEVQVEDDAGKVIASENVGTKREYTYPRASNGVEYEFKVRAKNKADWSAWGAAKTKPYSVPGEVATPNARPGRDGSGEIRVSWDPADDGGNAIKRYEVIAYRDGFEQKETLPARSRNFTFSNLEGGKEYNFRVRAENEAGWGKQSSPASATATTPPGKPRVNLTVSEGDVPKVAVSWNDVDSGGFDHVGYEAWYSINGGRERRADMGSGNSASFEVPGLDPGESVPVEVSVTAETRGGTSTGTKTEHVSRPIPEPDGLKITPEYGSNITLELDWNAAPDISTYKVSWSIDGGKEKTSDYSSTSAVLTNSDGPFEPGQKVKVTVQSRAPNGATSDAHSKTHTIGPPPTSTTPSNELAQVKTYFRFFPMTGLS